MAFSAYGCREQILGREFIAYGCRQQNPTREFLAYRCREQNPGREFIADGCRLFFSLEGRFAGSSRQRSDGYINIT